MPMEWYRRQVSLSLLTFGSALDLWCPDFNSGPKIDGKVEGRVLIWKSREKTNEGQGLS